MQPNAFGTLADGRSVQAWTLGDPHRLHVTLLDYGARVHAIDVATAQGPRRVTLGRPDLAGYVADTAYLGAVIGRVGNRIAGGRFTLDDRTFRLSVNNGGNTLHGGKVGFDRAVWAAEPDGGGLKLRHVSLDGDQGFPGRLEATVRYTVADGALAIDYAATTDAPTIVGLTNHAYFNLDGRVDILHHRVQIMADRYTEVDESLIPTGALPPVANTPLDFSAPQLVGSRIGADHPQLRRARGYDFNYVLADAPRREPALAGRVEAGGIVMEVLTTEPGVQFYSGNFLPDAELPLRAALCLETQHAPDAPNHPNFPSIVLRPGQTMSSRTIYRFTEA